MLITFLVLALRKNILWVMKNKSILGLSFAVYFIFLFMGCEELAPSEPLDEELLDGPIAGMTTEQNRLFLEGDIAFNDDIFTPDNGLGPVFVANSCGTCHPGDGKGHPSTSLVRFGVYEQGDFDPLLELGGPQLQNRAIPGFTPEKIPEEATGITKLTPPAVTGLGFLEEVPDQVLLDLADPDDVDGDGISGVPNWVEPPDFFVPKSHNISQNGKYIGRFGKKAFALTLMHQTVLAYKQDIGITSDFDTEDIFNPQVATQAVDNVPDPEVSAATVRNVAFYLRTLKIPVPRDQDDPAVITGKSLFMEIGCGSCHIPTLQTGESDIGVLANKEIHPYTDLLLHDMGPDLDDGYTEGSAKTYEWRTPPLWGLGLSENSQGGEIFLMHDGRARSIEEAILLHGGEAIQSRENYNALTDIEKQNLIKFLESL